VNCIHLPYDRFQWLALENTVTNLPLKADNFLTDRALIGSLTRTAVSSHVCVIQSMSCLYVRCSIALHICLGITPCQIVEFADISEEFDAPPSLPIIRQGYPKYQINFLIYFRTMHTNIHTYIHSHIYIHSYTHIHKHMHAYIRTYIHIHSFIHRLL
jgi:hypothetical protein